MVKIKKSIILLIALFIIFSYNVFSEPVIYSEKFRIDTSLESDIIEIPIYIKDATDLYAFKLDTTYDNSNLVSFNDLVEGSFLKQGNIELINGIDLDFTTHSSGLIENVLLSRKSVETGATGNGQLFILKLNKLGDGIIDLKLNNIELSNSIPEEITNFDVYYLIPWTQNSEYEINSNVNFYATYETQSSEINDADCKIKIDSVNYNMAYDQASKSYIYTKSFETTEKKQYSITCDSFYTVESSIMVVDTSTPPIDPICGNDILEEPEECDDGNIISNDGCSFECKKEIINSDCTVDSDCDNSLYCDGTEICNNGVCKSGTPPIKNDNIDCTIDYCDEELNLIVNQADHSICQNGLWCDGTEICDINLGCQNGEIQTCNDNIECSVDSCNEGLNLSDNSGSCLFDNSNCDCNIDSDCNDNNECTNDLCGTNSKCVNNPLNQTTCDDNLFCTEKDMCIEGICTGTK